MPDLECFLHAIVERRRKISADRALLVGISGIDGSGKGYIGAKIASSLGNVVARRTAGVDPGGPEIAQHSRPAGLSAAGYNIALISADGWLNLPHIRFARENSAEHFYDRALRLEEMFERLILPLRDHREVDLEMDFADETARTHRRRRYQFRDIDIILLEGIFLFKRAYRPHFDLTCWIDCTFETALTRAVRRRQEGLPPEETVRAFETIYFPAQRIHLQRDNPRAAADLLLPNDTDEIVSTPGQPCGTSNSLPKR